MDGRLEGGFEEVDCSFVVAILDNLGNAMVPSVRKSEMMYSLRHRETPT
jgi:hypothetical protein